MNRLLPNSKQSGFSMIEALVALVIMSFGLIALVRFQVNMVGYGGLVKAKTAAVTLAQEKMEDLRNMVLESQYTGMTDTPSTSDGCATDDGFVNDGQVTRVNTVFTRCYKIATIAENLTNPAAANPGYKNITTKLVWNDAASVTQSVVLNSIIAWVDPHDTAQLTAASEFSSDTLSTPTGGAYLGGDNNYSDGLPQGAVDNNDGTSTYEPGDGTTELIDNSTGEVLLTVISGQGIASISGKVYVEGTGPSATTTANASYPVVSDAGYCSRTFGDPISTIASKFTYFEYTCYVGSTWYGNIGIVRTDNPNNNARVCLGDPSANNTVLSTVRTYRGYETRTDDQGAVIVDGQGDAVYFPVGITSGTHFGSHDFLVTTITGNPADSDCVTPMSSTPQQFGSNPTDFYCLTVSCPGNVTYANLSISGTYTASMVNSIQVTNGGLCTMTSGTFVCDVTYVAGSTWSGSITINPATGYEVCSDNPLAFSGLSSDSSGNAVTLAATGTCAGGGPSTFEIEGYVTIASGNPSPKTSSLSGLTLAVSPTTDASCTYEYTDGDLNGEIECTVPSGFTGTITLGGYDHRDNANILDYSASPVTSNLTGQNISIVK